MIIDIRQIQKLIREGKYLVNEALQERVMTENLTEDDVIFLHKTFRALQFSKETAHLMIDMKTNDFKPFIRVDYEEFKPETYWGIVVSHNGQEEIFFSKDFKNDLYSAIKKYPDHYMSSSVTSYMQDAKISIE